MIPQYFNANNLEQVRRFRSDTVQAVPEREDHDESSLFSDDCVLDLSKYLTSTSPQGYFNDFFDVDKMRSVSLGHNNNNNTVKVKEEPVDDLHQHPTSNNSRCSTPDSFVPDEFEEQDFPSPTFQPLTTNMSSLNTNNVNNVNNVNNNLLRTVAPLHVAPANGGASFHVTASSIPGTSAIQAALQNTSQNNSAAHGAGGVGGLKLPRFSQLQSIQQHRFTTTTNNNSTVMNKNAATSFPLTSTASSIASSMQSSANTSDSDNSDEEMMTSSQLSADMTLNAKRLQQALNQLQDGSSDLKQEPMDMDGYPGFAHLNKLRPGGHFKGKQRKFIEKGTEEYVLKRERNNVAVRKSRTKAKLKHIETQMRVGELNEENSQLRNRISALQKEVSSLKSFISYHIPNASAASGRTPSASTTSHVPTTSSSSPASLTNSPVKHTPAPPVSPAYTSYGGRSASGY